MKEDLDCFNYKTIGSSVLAVNGKTEGSASSAGIVYVVSGFGVYCNEKNAYSEHNKKKYVGNESGGVFFHGAIPRGLNRVEAAGYVGVSPSKFDEPMYYKFS